MKKILLLAAIAAMVLAGCDDEPPSAPVDRMDGLWKGTYGANSQHAAGEIEFRMTFGDTRSWTVQFKDIDGFLEASSGRLGSRSGNVQDILGGINIQYGHATMSNDGKTLMLDIRTGSGGGLSDVFPIASRRQLYSLTRDSGGTSLRMQNESGIEITEVIWNNVSFTAAGESIRPGTNAARNVQSGLGYVFFKQRGSPIAVRTNDLVTVADNEEAEFIFTNNTLIMEINNINTREPLGTFFTNPWIAVKQGETEVNLYSEFDFGGTSLDSTKDITFTIENIGGGNLILETDNSSRITLGGNANGFFTITRQPVAASILPGNSILFTIRFNPTAVGVNYASVHIKSNAKNTIEEFVFEIKGSNEYQIGETGPGGGIIFFAQGNQYKECSGELGSYNWSGAVDAARNHRGNNFTNWQLPDIEELRLMYQNLHRNGGIGGFSGTTYWSSSRVFSTDVYLLNFGSGITHLGNNASQSHRVRAVRSFSL